MKRTGIERKMKRKTGQSSLKGIEKSRNGMFKKRIAKRLRNISRQPRQGDNLYNLQRYPKPIYFYYQSINVQSNVHQI